MTHLSNIWLTLSFHFDLTSQGMFPSLKVLLYKRKEKTIKILLCWPYPCEVSQVHSLGAGRGGSSETERKSGGVLSSSPSPPPGLKETHYAYNNFCILIGWEHANLSQTVRKHEIECKNLKLRVHRLEIENDWHFFNSLRANYYANFGKSHVKLIIFNKWSYCKQSTCNCHKNLKKKTAWQKLLYAYY